MSEDLKHQLAGLSGEGDTTTAAAASQRFAARAVDAGLVDVAYTVVDTPVGSLLTAATERGVVTIAFGAEERAEQVLAGLAARVSPRVLEAPARLDPLRRQLEEYFEGSRREFDLPLDWSLIGPFARRIRRRTAAIPYGEMSVYAQVAAEAGSPRASRAAGNALARNPIPIVIPCHRVLRTGGALGGYGGGLDRKRLLLQLEGALEPTQG